MDYRKYKLDRRSLLGKAQEDCLREMYAKAQPSMDYDAIIARNKELRAKGVKRDDLPRDYEDCYLSQEECRYIVNKYVEAYGVCDIESDGKYKEYPVYKFDSDVDLLIRDMTDGCSKDKWFEEHTDEHGFTHPGYRGYEKVPPIKELIGEENANKVIDYLKERKDFYRFDKQEYLSFSYLYMYAPHSNLDFIQKKYPDLQIDPRHLTFNEFWEEEEYGGVCENEDE